MLESDRLQIKMMQDNSENYPRLVPVGDSALLVEFENRIAESINVRVLNLKKKIDAVAIRGVVETVSSYRSLLIHYNCLAISLTDLVGLVEPWASDVSSSKAVERTWKIPVCYEGEAAVDLEDVARLHDLTTEEVIRLHRESVYRVYMVGFAPGWCYLGGLDPKLHTPRLKSPRLKVPAGCISIGGQQGMIGAQPMPSGWRLLGQTPIKTYVSDRTPPFFISAGDYIEFYRIDRNEFLALDRAVEKGDLVAEEVIFNE